MLYNKNKVVYYYITHKSTIRRTALAYTFKGGIYVDDHKRTSRCAIEAVTDPPIVKISMNHTYGTPATPTVKVGDSVKIGQVIGDVPESELGCPVHASVSGKVLAIEEILSDNGTTETAVVIENDCEGTVHESVIPFTGSITSLSREEIINTIRRAGIVGMGGEGYPTHEKIRAAVGKAEYLIVNCAESEPFATADHRLLLEEPRRVIGGVKILMRALGAPQAIIAVGDNKMNVIRKYEKGLRGQSMISVRVLKTKYPQGDERQLVFALTGREISCGKAPVDAGCVILNPATCAAVYTAFAEGMPLVRRVVTVSGDCVKNPANLSVPVGCPVPHMLEHCGGLKRTPDKLIVGGPMTGKTRHNAEIYIKKSTTALTLLSDKYSKKSKTPPVCIRCGKCVSICPMRLMPAYIASLSVKGDFKGAESLGAMSCIECGACAYGCPGNVEITHHIRIAKEHLRQSDSHKDSEEI